LEIINGIISGINNMFKLILIDMENSYLPALYKLDN